MVRLGNGAAVPPRGVPAFRTRQGALLRPYTASPALLRKELRAPKRTTERAVIQTPTVASGSPGPGFSGLAILECSSKFRRDSQPTLPEGPGRDRTVFAKADSHYDGDLAPVAGDREKEPMPDRSDHRPRLTILTGHASGVPPVVEPLEHRQFLSGSAVSIAATGLLTDMGVVVAAAVPWAAPAGESGANGMGTSSGRGQLLVIAVTPAQSPPRVTDLTIVNAADGSALGPLVDGVDLTLPPGASSISIIAGAAGSVGSVVFAVDGRRVHVENSAPYSIAGESGNGVFKPWTPPTGSHTLTVTPYMGQDGAAQAARRSPSISPPGLLNRRRRRRQHPRPFRHRHRRPRPRRPAGSPPKSRGRRVRLRRSSAPKRSAARSAAGSTSSAASTTRAARPLPSRCSRAATTTTRRPTRGIACGTTPSRSRTPKR